MQTARYGQLLIAVGLDVDNAYFSASFGGSQILRENCVACEYASPFAFVMAQAQSESNQLAAFVAFLQANGLDRLPPADDRAAFAHSYNDFGFVKNW